MTNDLTDTTTDQLAAELAARQAAAEADQVERQRRLEEAQERWDRDLVDRYDALDRSMVDGGDTHRAAVDEALRAGDLSAAYNAWVAERAARYGRMTLRNLYIGAASRTGQGRVLPDMRPPMNDEFSRRVEETADRDANAFGYAAANELAGERPTHQGDTK